MMTENVARYFGGSYMKERYIKTIKNSPDEDANSDEIINKIKNKIKNL